MRNLLLWLLLACGIVACDACLHKQTSPTITPSDAANICNHLAEIHCMADTHCNAVVASDQGVMADFKVNCLLLADSPAAANACGTIVCTPDGGAP